MERVGVGYAEGCTLQYRDIQNRGEGAVRSRGGRIGGRMRRRQDRAEGEGVRGVGSHYVEGGDVTDGDGWLHVRQV